MNKAELVEAIALDVQISRVATKKVVDALLRATIQTLQDGEKLSLSGFGTFSIAHKPARMGRNPRTGAPVKIAPKKIIKFSPTLEVK
ncbi:MAG: HU family DNA-binding protein [Alistipes sp.]